MKTPTLLLITLLLLVPPHGFAQLARQNVLLEHYTAVDCGFCGIFNPRLFDTIGVNNDGSVHILSYHTGYAQSDPMYLHNPSDIHPREHYYNVAGIPNLVVQGKEKAPLPNVKWLTMDTNKVYGSPVRIIVKESFNGKTYDVDIEVQSVGTPPPGDWLLRVAVIQKEETYLFAPGVSGETHFPHVFRRFVNDDGPDGEPITLPPKGNSTIRNYTFGDHPDWNGEMYIVAFLQNASSKEILNSGSSMDPGFELVNTSDRTFQKSKNAGNRFSALLVNTGPASATYELKLNADEPSTWGHQVSLEGQTISNSINITVSGGATKVIDLVVYPGEVTAVGTYQVIAREIGNDTYLPQRITFHVASPISDVVVNNKGITNYNYEVDWTDTYLAGLEYAGNSNYSAVNYRTFVQGMKAGVFDKLRNIYFHQWGYPAMSTEFVNILSAFMDGGGNVLVAGNGIGFSNNKIADGGSDETRSFFQEYMHAEYIDHVNYRYRKPKLYWNDFDPVFGEIKSICSVDNPEGHQYLTYVEWIKPRPGSPASPFVFYDNKRTEIAGIRAKAENYKMVYLAIGLEMIESPTIQKEFIRQTHDWFYGKNDDMTFDDLYYTAYPNPTNYELHIRLNQPLSDQSQLRVYNSNGQVVLQESLSASNYMHTVNVSLLPGGIYIYQIIQDDIEIQKQSFIKR